MTVTKKIPIWLDCDPGNDDAFAILLALFDPRFDLLGISTVHGNAPLDMTTHNALALLDMLNIKPGTIKVYKGSEKPLINPPKYAAEMHGHTGIGGVIFPEHTKNQVAEDMTYLEALKHAILNYENEICLVCTGTLTNISKLISVYPELKDKIKYVSIMGGGINMGNVTPFAEFNFHTDPHAAQDVVKAFSSKIILTPLNLTHKAVATEEVRNRIYDRKDPKRSSGTRKLFYDILNFFANAYAKKYGITGGPPVHDPLALFSLLPFIDSDPENEYGYKYLRRKLNILTKGEREGESVVANGNYDMSVEEDDGVYIGDSVNVDEFWGSVIQSLEAAEIITNY
ncbi:uridine nucleosidase [Scheffersomyces xylosifermentans]|uniref:uridine nucleosidase n=1 Tax=Scheffersomyces xylosifermentans TaxID=1304137 RepID=UPI00315C59E0